MKFLLILLFGITISAQTPEQAALDFYAKEFKVENKGKRIRFDGKISTLDDKYANSSVLEFYDCKWQEKFGKKLVDDNASENYEKVYEELKLVDLKYEEFIEELEIPKELVRKKKLKNSSVYRSFFNYYLNKVWYLIFPEKYNVTIYPSVYYNSFYFVQINIDKKDNEHGNMFYFKLSNDLRILDNCKRGWIQ